MRRRGGGHSIDGRLVADCTSARGNLGLAPVNRPAETDRVRRGYLFPEKGEPRGGRPGTRRTLPGRRPRRAARLRGAVSRVGVCTLFSAVVPQGRCRGCDARDVGKGCSASEPLGWSSAAEALDSDNCRQSLSDPPISTNHSSAGNSCRDRPARPYSAARRI